MAKKKDSEFDQITHVLNRYDVVISGPGRRSVRMQFSGLRDYLSTSEPIFSRVAYALFNAGRYVEQGREIVTVRPGYTGRAVSNPRQEDSYGWKG